MKLNETALQKDSFHFSYHQHDQLSVTKGMV